jgi:hypothetical protein
MHESKQPGSFKISAWLTQAAYASTTTQVQLHLATQHALDHVARHDYLSSVCSGSTSTMPCAMVMSSVAPALLPLCRASGCVIPSLDFSSVSQALPRTGSTSTLPCASSTHLPVAQPLPQLCHASWLLVTRSHRLYLKLTVCREYSSLGRTGSTSTASHVQVPHLLARLVVDHFAASRGLSLKD